MSRLALACYGLTAGVLIALVVFELSRDDVDVAPAPRAARRRGIAVAHALAYAFALTHAHATAGREGARGRGDGVQREPGRRARGQAGARAVERGARQARRDPARRTSGSWSTGRRSSRRRRRPPTWTSRRPAACATIGPCLGWGGVREQLRALASRQREGGWKTLVVFTEHAGLGGEPAERVRAPAGRAALAPAARRTRCPPTARWSATCSSAAGEEGAALTLLEPLERAQPPGVHQPAAAGVRPGGAEHARPPPTRRSRGRCSRRWTTRPGDQQLVLGETAGLMKSTRYVTSVPDFIAGLPTRPVCRPPCGTQHAYIGGDDPVERGRRGAEGPRLPAPVHGLDHRDRRRPRARRTSARAARSPTPRPAAAPFTASSCAGTRTRA